MSRNWEDPNAVDERDIERGQAVESPWLGVWNLPAGVEVQPLHVTGSTVQGIMTVPLCPDMLNYQNLGAADSFRGRLIRGFFRLLDFTPW